MATHDIFMPALSSTMTEGKIVQWLKQPGDRVARGESVLVVESDKADMDVESFEEGFLAVVLVEAGGTAPVGDTIGLIAETEAEIAEVQAKAQATKPAASVPAPAPVAPAPAPPVATPPAPVAAPVAPVASAPVPPTPPPAPERTDGRLVATPRAKKLATQLGVRLEGLRGSGPNGRIQAEDVERAAGQAVSVPRVAEGTAPATNGSGAPPQVAAAPAPAGAA
ncbi:MAG: biotin/lipoyl-containing protein, partial [Cyanobacteriota bacterium]